MMYSEDQIFRPTLDRILKQCFSFNENENGDKNDNDTKTIISKRSYIVLWHFLVLIVTDMKCSCLFYLSCNSIRTTNFVALAILIGT